MRKTLRFIIILASIFSLITSSVTVYANTFYELNDILFYDPDSNTLSQCTPSMTGPIPGDENLQKIYNFLLSKGASKKVAAAMTGNIYQESKGDHLVREGGSRVTDPTDLTTKTDGWGLIQWTPGNRVLQLQKDAGVTGSVADLETQLEIIWWHLTNKGKAPTSRNVVILDEAEKEPDVVAATIYIRKFFFAPAEKYAGDENRTQAAIKAMSYPVDPSITITSNDPAGSCDTTGVNGTLSEGGLNESQAKQFMINYGANKNNSTKNAMTAGLWNACGGGGGGSNCVSFSAFFINKFTEMKAPNPMGNGHTVVDNLARQGVPTGKEPRVGAVFSINKDDKWGHTGVVLGIQGDTIITGHASCTRGNRGLRGAGDGSESGSGSGFVRTGGLKSSVWLYNYRSDLVFAYPDINLDAMSKYIETGE